MRLRASPRRRPSGRREGEGAEPRACEVAKAKASPKAKAKASPKAPAPWRLVRRGRAATGAVCEELKAAYETAKACPCQHCRAVPAEVTEGRARGSGVRGVAPLQAEAGEAPLGPVPGATGRDSLESTASRAFVWRLECELAASRTLELSCSVHPPRPTGWPGGAGGVRGVVASPRARGRDRRGVGDVARRAGGHGAVVHALPSGVGGRARARRRAAVPVGQVPGGAEPAAGCLPLQRVRGGPGVAAWRKRAGKRRPDRGGRAAG